MARRAPVAVFAYRRPRHLQRLLESLGRNPEAGESPLRIYCDGPRGDSDRADVAAVREVARALAPPQARIVERDRNLGLAASVIAGVGELAAEFGEVVVLEDDLVLSPYALEFLNRALERYRNEPRVMHVSAYMFPVAPPPAGAFFCREATCWGWATWARAWSKFDPDAARIRDAVLARGERRAFDAGGSYDFFRVLEAQVRGEVDSWAIRWYGSMWLQGGLSLHPDRALAANTGHDGSGEHCTVTREFEVALRDAPLRELPDAIEVSAEAERAIRAYRERARGGGGWLGRIWRRLAG